MKWMAIVIVAAGLLITAGIVVTSGGSDKALSDNPEANALYKEGTQDLEAFRLQAAITKLDQALELDPLFAEAAISRAFAKGRLGRIPEYLQEVSLADSLVTGILDGDRRMIAELRLSGEKASRYFAIRDSLVETLQDRHPENIYVMLAQAYNVAMSGSVEEQRQAWLGILEVDPNYAGAYNLLGYLELNQGNFKQAIEYLQRYAFLAPEDANPHDSLGEVYMVIGEYEKAETEFRTSVTMQPDFYHSLINLAKTYLARGQLETGREILEKVRPEVAGTAFEKRIDKPLIETYLVNGLVEDLDRMTAYYVNRYPEDNDAAFYRGLRLAHMGRMDESQALADSMFSSWHKKHQEEYGDEPAVSIDTAETTFAALIADLRSDPAERVALWRAVVALQSKSHKASHEKWFEIYLLAQALNDGGQHREALDYMHDILIINSRLIAPLTLTVECYLDLQDAESAGKTLKKLQWAISRSDSDYPARARANELQERLNEMIGSS